MPMNVGVRNAEIFALWKTGRYTLAAIGERYGLGRERIRQLCFLMDPGKKVQAAKKAAREIKGIPDLMAPRARASRFMGDKVGLVSDYLNGVDMATLAKRYGFASKESMAYALHVAKKQLGIKHDRRVKGDK